MSQVQTQTEFQPPGTMRTKIFLSVVIPAYNEAENLPRTLKELKEIILESPSIGDYEFFIVDDHSSDHTFELIQSFKDAKISCIRLSRRSGSHTALRAGISCVRGEAALCLSADGQDDPHVLNEMLKKLLKGIHVVWGVRKKREEPFWDKLFALIAYKLIHLLVNPLASESKSFHADFYILSKKVVDAINRCPERNTSLFGLILWLGFKQDFVEYERRARRSGKSKWSFTRSFRLMTDWIVAFSGIPLKLMSLLGFLTAALGFSYALFIVVYSLLGYAKPGWAETVILILVLGGAQMMMLGILGEYLWRTLDETRRRPLYFIEDRTD